MDSRVRRIKSKGQRKKVVEEPRYGILSALRLAELPMAVTAMLLVIHIISGDRILRS
jgi:hypothetical protein